MPIAQLFGWLPWRTCAMLARILVGSLPVWLLGCSDAERVEWVGRYASARLDYSDCYNTKPNPTTICQLVSGNHSGGLPCPQGWTRGGEDCYQVLDQQGLSFVDALAACQQRNGTLPLPKLEAAHSVVRDLCGTKNLLGCWLGLVEGCEDGQIAQGIDGNWTWLDCSVTNIQSRWIGGEPDNFNQIDEKAAVMNKDTKAVFCSRPRSW
mmetsp:Transcript_91799/g.159036  ORF Transcript_91799/g.159036 Transcript_91799/m.159036 type:complete len:208 (+) Transcript_91799:31-654(+)